MCWTSLLGFSIKIHIQYGVGQASVNIGAFVPFIFGSECKPLASKDPSS
jgi:hypothetical protein